MSLPEFIVGAPREKSRTEPGLVRVILIASALIFLTVFVVLPLAVVFAQAFSKVSAPTLRRCPTRKRCRRSG